MGDTLHRRSSTGISTILSHSYKVYDVHMDSFDAADGKAGGIIGQVAVAVGIIGYATMGKTDAAAKLATLQWWSLGATLLSFLVFALAVCCALAVLRPRSREAAAPPSALTALEYWEESGDAKTVAAIIRGMDSAQRTVRDAAGAKGWWLRRAYELTGGGFLCAAVAVALHLIACHP